MDPSAYWVSHKGGRSGPFPRLPDLHFHCPGVTEGEACPCCQGSERHGGSDAAVVSSGTDLPLSPTELHRPHPPSPQRLRLVQRYDRQRALKISLDRFPGCTKSRGEPPHGQPPCAVVRCEVAPGGSLVPHALGLAHLWDDGATGRGPAKTKTKTPPPTQPPTAQRCTRIGRPTCGCSHSSSTQRASTSRQQLSGRWGRGWWIGP